MWVWAIMNAKHGRGAAPYRLGRAPLLESAAKHIGPNALIWPRDPDELKLFSKFSEQDFATAWILKFDADELEDVAGYCSRVVERESALKIPCLCAQTRDVLVMSCLGS